MGSCQLLYESPFLKSLFLSENTWFGPLINYIYVSLSIKTTILSRSRFSSVGKASGSQIFWEHEFESRQPHLCNSMWGQDWLHAGCQEVSKCSTRGESWGMYITFASAMRIRQPTLALKPRGDITRNPKQGYQWPQKWTCVRQKL